MLVPRSEVIELDMDVEAAVKMIVSLGVVVPKWSPRGGVSRACEAEDRPVTSGAFALRRHGPQRRAPEACEAITAAK